MDLVKEAWEKTHRRYGYRKVGDWIRKHKGTVINYKAVLRLMRKLDIRSIARQPKAFKVLTQLETYHQYENVLNRQFTASQPNQKWVTDITYVRIKGGWAFLSVIKDLYDGFIVAHKFKTNKRVPLVTETLQQAQRKEKVTAGLILHSDQGHQYTSQAYFVLTKKYNITPSMSRKGNCWDNAPMESFFSQIKEEMLHHIQPLSFAETSDMIDDYIDFYNYKRLRGNSMLTPYELRCQYA
jgi:transposase InsO family protein